ncbi:MAG: hypothetical protein JWN84_2915 [Nocardioides sp.]|nr:hypothetical protein [Nocardioides sp.]
MPSRPPVVSRVSRRALLGGVVATTATASTACSLDSLDPSPDDPTITPTSGPGSTDDPTAPAAEPAADDDEGLVGEVLAAIALAHRTARANARQHPGLAPVLRPFETLHTTHADELGDLPASTGRVADRRESRTQVLARVDRSETVLQRTLVGAARSAGSGALAQTFASMAAGVAQLRTTL